MNNKDFNLTIKEIKDWIKKYNPPDDAIVLVERVHDVYFDKHNWETVKKPHDIYSDENVEYIEAFCTVKFKDDNNLYINCHY